MMKTNDDKIIMLKQRLAAISEYHEKGMDSVKRIFPEQVKFVEDNKDKEYSEVVDSIDRELSAIFQN